MKGINKIVVEEKSENQDEFIITQESLKSMIYHIRGQKIMLDFELAEIYGYTTTRFNQ